MKKAFWFFCTLLVMGPVFVFAGGQSGTAKSGSEPQKTVTLQFWGGVPPESGPQASADEFNVLYKDKGIQVEYTRFVNDANGNVKLETTLLAGEGIDLFMSYDLIPLAKRVEGNMALDLTDYINRDAGFDRAGFGSALNQYAINGRLYTVPTILKSGQMGLLVNKNMFDAAGIPVPKQWTMSQFRETAKKLTQGSGENKIYGVFFNPNPNILRPIEVSAILTLGGDWMYAPDGKKSGINVPDVKNVIQTIHDMMNIDKSAPTYGDMMSQKQTMEGVFLAGKAAITYGAWSIRSVKDVQNYPHDFVTAFAPYPIPDNQKEIYAYGGHSDFLSVNSKTKNADASWEFIKWYSTKGMMPLVVGGRIPVYSGYNINEVAAAIISGAEKLLDPVTTAEVLELKDQYAIPEITFKGSEITQVYIEEAEAVLTGRKQIDAGLSDAQTRADRILGQ